jgi:copper chaperone
MATNRYHFLVKGMHCGSCALLIDDTLEDLPGITDTHTSLKTGRTTVDLDPKHNSPADVLNAIRELGYHATVLPT